MISSQSPKPEEVTMKKLILVRHGDYNANHRLSSLGDRQIRNLVDRLLPWLEGFEVRVLSSTAPRAMDSAKVFCEALGGHVTPELHKIFWSGEYDEDLPKATEVIQQNNDVDILVVVTHYEYVNGLPKYFCREVLDTPEAPRFRAADKGRAVVINCETKDVFLV